MAVETAQPLRALRQTDVDGRTEGEGTRKRSLLHGFSAHSPTGERRIEDGRAQARTVPRALGLVTEQLRKERKRARKLQLAHCT